MSLLSLFGSKKRKSDISFEFVEHDVSSYTPWDEHSINSDNDYANVNFLHMFSHGANQIRSTPDEYPRYVSYDLGIHDPVRKHKEFLNNGYLTEATASEVMSTLSASELKSIAETHGLSPKGKKADILSRIEASVPLDTLDLPTMYVVSEKGTGFINEHPDLVKLFRNPYNISYEEYMSAKNEFGQDRSYNDIVWYIFGKREREGAPKRNIALYRATFLKRENRFADSLYQYIVVLFYDVNDDFDEIAPGIRSAIYEMKEYFSPEMVARCYDRIDIKKKVSKASFEAVVDSVLRDEVQK